MTKQIIIFLLTNGFTGITLALVLQYVSVLIAKTTKQEEVIEYLCKKITQLEKHINEIQSNVEDMEEKYVERETDLIESNTQLNNKLEKFIGHNYDLLE